MSSEPSQEDLQAGGEGEVKDPPTELSAEKDNSSKTKSLGGKSASIITDKNGSTINVKSISAIKVKSGSAIKVKSGSAIKVKSGSAIKVQSGSAVTVKSGSVTTVESASVASKSLSQGRSKSGSVTAVKSGSATKSKLKIVQEDEAELSPTAEESSKIEMADSSKTSVQKQRTSEEEVKSLTSKELVGREPLVESTERIMVSQDFEDLSPSGLSPVATSIEATTANGPTANAQLYPTWSPSGGVQFKRMISTVIESVAMSHAASFVESSRRLDLPRRSATLVATTLPGPNIWRSVWEDDDVLNILGNIRMDALGENYIFSRQNSEELLQDILMTQFDIESRTERRPEKPADEIELPKEDFQSVVMEVSPAASGITGFWPTEVAVDKAEAEEKPEASLEERPEPSKATSVTVLTPHPVPKPCDMAKFTCFSHKDQISMEELSICSSDVAATPTNFVLVKFRLVTGQLLKRIYQPYTVFEEVICDLSWTLCVAPETIELSVNNEEIDLNATVWDVCKRKGTEVLVEADFCPEQIFSLVEQGVLTFNDEVALDRFLLRHLPCEPEKKEIYIPPVAPPKVIPQPSEFVPSLMDRQDKNLEISDELHHRKELADYIRHIQCCFRCYLSKRTFDQPKEPSSESASYAHIKESPCSECNALIRDVNLLTEEDFKTLYHFLEEWWQNEADTIKRNNSSAAKVARLFNLLLTEIDYLKDIEKHRSKLRKQKHDARIWEHIQDIEYWECLEPQERVEMLQIVICKMTYAIFGNPKKAMREVLRSDMNAIIKGRSRRTEETACWHYCLTCHRLLPLSQFKPASDSKRLRSCEKCLGLANMGRGRTDERPLKLLMEDLRNREAALGGCSWLPYIMQERDFASLANLWHNVSAISGTSCDLRFVRWDPTEEWSPWNTVLLTSEEAAAHNIDEYARDFVDIVEKRLLTAKWKFKSLIEAERKRRKAEARDLKDKEACWCTRSESTCT